MKENPSYQSIRKLLEKASLKPRKSDWDQMNSLLNKHLPTSGIHVNPLKFIKYFTGGASVVLITAAISIMHFHNSVKNKKSGPIIKDRQTINRLSRPEQESPINKMFNMPHDSSLSESTPVQTENIISAKPEKLPGSENTSPNQLFEKSLNIKNDQSNAFSKELKKEGESTADSKQITNSNNHPDAFRRIDNKKSPDQSPQPDIPGSSKITTDYSVAKVHERNHIKKFRPEDIYPISLDLSLMTHPVNPQNTGSLLQESIVNNIPAFPIKSNNITGKKENHNTGGSTSLNNSENKSGSQHSPASAIFEYGINLPLLQYYTSKDMQSIRVNYIPGITAQYFINNHLGIGIDLNPYQTQNTNSGDSIFTMKKIDSSISINHYISNTYYIRNLNTLKLGVHFSYRAGGHFGLDLGLSYQHSYNGNGFVTSEIIPDTGQLSIPNQNVHYAGGDTAFAQVTRSNFYYSLNAVFPFDKCDIVLGYNQNVKSWTNASSAKPAGWISLELRYYFSRPVKK